MPVKYDGVTMVIGGEEFTFPPLNFASIKRLRKEITLMTEAKIGDALSDNQIDAFMALIHASLVRNYPDMTVDGVAEMVDLHNVGMIVQGIMLASGFVAGGATARSEQET